MTIAAGQKAGVVSTKRRLLFYARYRLFGYASLLVFCAAAGGAFASLRVHPGSSLWQRCLALRRDPGCFIFKLCLYDLRNQTMAATFTLSPLPVTAGSRCSY